MVQLSIVGNLSLIGIDQKLWDAITDIAHRERMTVGDLLAQIDQRRTAAVTSGHQPPPLSSAVRVFVAIYQQQSRGLGPVEASVLTEHGGSAGFQGGHA